MSDQVFDTINLFESILFNGNRSPQDLLLALGYTGLFVLTYIFLRLVFMILHLMWVSIINHRVVVAAQPFSANRSGIKKILIVGDSTAFGTGASDPNDSIAGRLARDFPRTDIVNVAVNGSIVSGAVRQLASVAHQKFDLIIVSTGGNDIWRLTPISRISKSLSALLQKAAAMSNRHVIVLYYANFGSSSAIPLFLKPLLARRAEHIRAVFEETCAALAIPCIDLFTKTGRSILNPFQTDPDRYFARDHMHPSSEGYKAWYSHMWYELVKRGYLFSEAEQHGSIGGTHPPETVR